jgi:tetratricopeptide (TPR) repeat protein
MISHCSKMPTAGCVGYTDVYPGARWAGTGFGDSRSNPNMMRPARLILAATLIIALRAAAAAQEPVPVGMDGNPVARIVLDGNAAFLRGDLHQAAIDYHRALERKPDFAVASFNLGLVEAHRGERARGLADMDRGIALAASHRMAVPFVNRLRALRRAFAAQPIST